jgi:hypothetical protein
MDAGKASKDLQSPLPDGTMAHNMISRNALFRI